MRSNLEMQKVTFGRGWFLLLAISVAMITMSTTVAQKNNCRTLLEELTRAQKNYDTSVGVWKQATAKVTQAEFELGEVRKKLNDNDKKDREAMAALEKAQADQKTCDSTNPKDPVAPLLDCAAVPGRIQRAQQEMAEAKIANAKLEAEEQKWKAEIERREEAVVAAHQEERNAWRALEAARDAYAQCGAFWIGTITNKYKQRSEPVDKTTTSKGGDGIPNTTTRTSDWWTEVTLEAIIQPSSGGDTQQLTARVTRTYERHWHDTTKTDEAQWCRPPHAKSHWERFANTDTNNQDESGSITTLEPVRVNIYSNGAFEISLTYPAVVTRTHVERTATFVGCSGAAPKSNVEDSQGSPVSEAFTTSNVLKITGAFDPKTPNVLVGKRSEGYLSNGETTTAWDLRLIKPKTRP
jgi:hypothetical protein